ncbi:MAG: tRNA-binding protein [candidate division Zixibacteria bacterium]|nr:tRNA-binding protein [candidate division Zixibacteria bacterium]
MKQISWSEFETVELRVGTVVAVEDFPEARKPAYKLTIDLGPFGVKKSSAQVTTLYSKDDLTGRQVLCVINFPPKRIGPFVSEVLTTGFVMDNGDVVLAIPERPVPDGSKLA